MNIINHNPYRVVGVLAGASAREVQAQKGKIQAFSRVGKELTSEYDFRFLESIQRTEDNINKAFSQVEQNADKVKNALFWFVNHSPIDQMALEYLKNGDTQKGIEIWLKIINSQSINGKNFSVFNNISTYWLLDEKSSTQMGIYLKIQLIESECFKDFVHLVADETYTIDKDKQIEIFIDEVISEFRKKYDTAKVFSLFEKLEGNAQTYVSKKFTEEPIHIIETQVQICKDKRTKNKAEAYSYANNLITNTKSALLDLKNIIGENNLLYKKCADDLAKEILQCSVDFCNEHQERESNNNYLEKSIQLVKLAEKIAINSLTQERIKENLKTLEEMKERELNQTVLFLKMVEENYDKNFIEINQAVVKQMDKLGYGQTINWDKVDEIVKNSIAWDKVIEALKQIVSKQDIAKIKASTNADQLKEYRRLVEFLMDKLNYSQKREMEYLCYWKTSAPTTSTSNTTRTSTTSSNTNKTSSTYTNSGNADDNDGCLSMFFKLLLGALAIFVLVKMCGSTKKTEYSDSNNLYQYEQEATPIIEYEESNDIEKFYETSNYYSEEDDTVEDEENYEEENY